MALNRTVSDEPITLVLKPNLWRVVLSNDLVNPTRVRHITIKGASSARGAIDSALHTDSHDNFKEEFPLCVVAKVEFLGIVDNG